MGLISGRKAFQRPMAEGVELLNAIQDVYLDERITDRLIADSILIKRRCVACRLAPRCQTVGSTVRVNVQVPYMHALV